MSPSNVHCFFQFPGSWSHEHGQFEVTKIECLWGKRRWGDSSNGCFRKNFEKIAHLSKNLQWKSGQNGECLWGIWGRRGDCAIQLAGVALLRFLSSGTDEDAVRHRHIASLQVHPHKADQHRIAMWFLFKAQWHPCPHVRRSMLLPTFLNFSTVKCSNLTPPRDIHWGWIEYYPTIQ